jgi:hypothetical protein
MEGNHHHKENSRVTLRLQFKYFYTMKKYRQLKGWVETNLPNICIFCTDVRLCSTIRHRKQTSIQMLGRLVSFHPN